MPNDLITGTSLSRRRALLGALGVAATAAGVSGCASMHQIAVDVATFGAWPAARKPGRVFFERLPSQQRDPQALAVQQAVEDAATASLVKAGFTRVDKIDAADVVVRAGAQRTRVLDPWADAGFYGRGVGRVGIGVGVGIGPGWRRPWPYGSAGFGMGSTLEQRDVMLVLSDRSSREVLFEGHARHDSRYASEEVLPALFDALLTGFPAVVLGERRVLVSLPPA